MKKITQLLLSVILSLSIILTGCSSVDGSTSNSSDTTIPSTYISKTFNVEDDYHFFEKSILQQDYGLYSYKDATLTEVSLSSDFIYHKETHAIYQVDKSKLLSDFNLSEQAKIIDFHQNFIIVSTPRDAQNTNDIDVTFSTIDNVTVVAISSDTIYDYTIFQDQFYLVAARPHYEGTVLGTNMEIINLNFQESSYQNLGAFHWQKPMGGQQPLNHLIASETKLYAYTTTKIYEITNNEIIDTGITFSRDTGVLVSFLTSDGNNFYGTKSMDGDYIDVNHSTLYRWDEEFNVLDSIAVPSGIDNENVQISYGFRYETPYVNQNRLYNVSYQLVQRNMTGDGNFEVIQSLVTWSIDLESLTIEVAPAFYLEANEEMLLLLI